LKSHRLLNLCKTYRKNVDISTDISKTFTSPIILRRRRVSERLLLVEQRSQLYVTISVRCLAISCLSLFHLKVRQASTREPQRRMSIAPDRWSTASTDDCKYIVRLV